MTELTTTLHPKVQPDPAATAAIEPTLITEQQVMFSTAAAVALPPAKTHRWTDVIGSGAGAVRAWFAEALKPPSPQYRKGRPYIENALMSREMGRL